MHRIAKGSYFLLLCFSVLAFSCEAKVFYSKQEAMTLAFGEQAKVEMLSLFPKKAQQTAIEGLARVKMNSPLFTFYVAKKDGQIQAYAAIETRNVRTKPETLLVVLNAQGQLIKVETLAFHEPPEYLPPARWFAQLFNLPLDELSFGAGVQGISGATLSTRAGLDTVRKVLAIYQVMIAEAGR